jgi:hypothetical protein
MKMDNNTKKVLGIGLFALLILLFTMFISNFLLKKSPEIKYIKEKAKIIHSLEQATKTEDTTVLDVLYDSCATLIEDCKKKG